MLFFCFPPIKLTDMTVLIFLLLFIGSFLNLLWIHHSFIHSFIQINDLCVISLIRSLYNCFVLSSLVLSLFTQYSFIHYLTTHSLTHSLTCSFTCLSIQYSIFSFFLVFIHTDAMATEEWKKEVQKHEKYIKDLEDKFKLKCEEMQVVNCDYTKKNIKFYFNP